MENIENININVLDIFKDIHFDKVSFTFLIDRDNLLSDTDINYFWEGFQDFYSGNFQQFYNSLFDSKAHSLTIRKSMNQFFDSKILGILQSQDII